MRRYWGTLALVSIAALLGLYLIVVDNPRERSRSEQQERESRVLSLTEDDVTGLEITTPSDRLVLERTDGGLWRVTTPVLADADDGTVRRLLTQLTAMSVVRAIDEVGDEADLGVVDPAVRVTASRSNGPQAVVAFGAASPTGGGVYVKRDDGKLFLVSAATKSTFEVSRDDVRRKEFIAFQPETVTEVVITRPKRVVTLRRDGAEWRTVEPDRTADPERTASLLSRLRALRATGFVDDAGQRKALGLEAKPRLTLTVTSNARQIAVEFFGAADGALYVRTDGETLYRVNERVVDEMPLDAAAFRDMRVVRVSVDEVVDVEVVQGDAAYRTARREGGWEMDGRRLEPSAADAMDALVRALTALRGESVVSETVAAAPAAATLSSPAARVTLRGDNARVLTVVTIGGANGEARYAYADADGPVFLVASSVLEHIPSKSALIPKAPEAG
ncbi:MAG: DUF4340 domain-containing protein [Nitrospirota bacterium]